MPNISGGYSHDQRLSVEDGSTYTLGLLGKLQAPKEVAAVVNVSLVQGHYLQSTLLYKERGIFFLLLSYM